MWEDTQLTETITKTLFANFEQFSDLADALVTVILGYNQFLANGGDSDANSLAAQPWPSNYAAAGFKRLLLETSYAGMSGQVEYLQSGERNIKYQIYQMKAGDRRGCFVQSTLHSSINVATATSDQLAFNNLDIRSVAALWNFGSVNEVFNVT
eukprot:2042348-Heterocapsa_arctica.AAC.1